MGICIDLASVIQLTIFYTITMQSNRICVYNLLGDLLINKPGLAQLVFQDVSTFKQYVIKQGGDLQDIAWKALFNNHWVNTFPASFMVLFDACENPSQCCHYAIFLFGGQENGKLVPHDDYLLFVDRTGGVNSTNGSYNAVEALRKHFDCPASSGRQQDSTVKKCQYRFPL
jgi:hypothetical protein